VVLALAQALRHGAPSVTALLVALGAAGQAASIAGDERVRSGTGNAAGFSAESSGDLANIGGMNAPDTWLFGIRQSR